MPKKPRIRRVNEIVEDDSATVICRRCGNSYPRTLTFFGISREIKFGMSKVCRDCLNARYSRAASIRKRISQEDRKRKRLLDPVAYQLDYRRSWYGKVRREAVEHYGGVPPKCACCGESLYEFLAIDHIEGGGSEQRRKDKYFGAGFYVWLRKNNWPNGFRVLCHNCNQAYGYYGYCPHVERGIDVKDISIGDRAPGARKELVN